MGRTGRFAAAAALASTCPEAGSHGQVGAPIHMPYAPCPAPARTRAACHAPAPTPRRFTCVALSSPAGGRGAAFMRACVCGTQVLRHAVALSPDRGYEKYMYLGQLLDGQEALEAVRRGVAVLQVGPRGAASPPKGKRRGRTSMYGGLSQGRSRGGRRGGGKEAGVQGGGSAQSADDRRDSSGALPITSHSTHTYTHTDAHTHTHTRAHSRSAARPLQAGPC